MQQAQPAQFHHSYFRKNSRGKSALVLNGRRTQAGVVILVSLLVAAVVMAAAALIEPRLGPSAAGWVAALPVTFAVAVLAVMLHARTPPAGTMAPSAPTPVPAPGPLR